MVGSRPFKLGVPESRAPLGGVVMPLMKEVQGLMDRTEMVLVQEQVRRQCTGERARRGENVRDNPGRSIAASYRAMLKTQLGYAWAITTHSTELGLL